MKNQKFRTISFPNFFRWAHPQRNRKHPLAAYRALRQPCALNIMAGQKETWSFLLSAKERKVFLTVQNELNPSRSALWSVDQQMKPNTEGLPLFKKNNRSIIEQFRKWICFFFISCGFKIIG